MKHLTKDGAVIEMVRDREPNQVGGDRGWITIAVVAMLDSKNVGHLSISWIPDFDERYADLDVYREAFGGPFRTERDRARTKAFHGEPFVAAVLVDFPYHRRGIGLALYREAALWLAEEWDHRLRSGDPNQSSEGLWKKLEALGEPVAKVDVQDYHPRFALDYRDRAKTEQGEDVPES